MTAEARLTITAPNGDNIVVYGSALDLATLEKIVHSKTTIPPGMVLVPIDPEHAAFEPLLDWKDGAYDKFPGVWEAVLARLPK